MQNIILIGMPGCGKTTVGKLVAQRLHRPFFDADAEIVNRLGCDIPTFFAQEGEAAFRKVETEVLKDLGKRSGCVIATGGGCVLRPENVELLKKNGILIHLDTPFFRIVQNLSRDTSRPLLQGDKEKQTRTLYSQRKKIYEDCADVSVRGVRISEILMKLFRAL